MSCAPGARRQRRGHRAALTGGGQVPPLRKAAWPGAHSAPSGPAGCHSRKPDALLKPSELGPAAPSSASRRGRPSGRRCGTGGRARSGRWSRWASLLGRACRRPRLAGLGERRARGAGRSRASSDGPDGSPGGSPKPRLFALRGAGPQAAGPGRSWRRKTKTRRWRRPAERGVLPGTRGCASPAAAWSSYWASRKRNGASIWRVKATGRFWGVSGEPQPSLLLCSASPLRGSSGGVPTGKG